MKRIGSFAAIALTLSAITPAAAQENQALAAQRAKALPLTAFYDVGDADLSKPGTLIRSEPGTGYDLPAGVTATRIAYASRDANGRPVLATGVVLLPSGKASEGGWP